MDALSAVNDFWSGLEVPSESRILNFPSFLADLCRRSDEIKTSCLTDSHHCPFCRGPLKVSEAGQPIMAVDGEQAARLADLDRDIHLWNRVSDRVGLWEERTRRCGIVDVAALSLREILDHLQAAIDRKRDSSLEPKIADLKAAASKTQEETRSAERRLQEYEYSLLARRYKVINASIERLDRIKQEARRRRATIDETFADEIWTAKTGHESSLAFGKSGSLQGHKERLNRLQATLIELTL